MQSLFIPYSTIVIKEVTRFTRIWVQTILPPAISMTLYFVIFGSLIGPRIGTMNGFDYIDYIAPGIIMMSIINNSYANVVSSFYGAKFQRHIEEMLVAPIPNFIILAGFVTGGIVRGFLVGVVVTIVALFFTDLQLHSFPITISVVLMT
jgi:ABC-2 type transport system permease protein